MAKGGGLGPLEVGIAGHNGLQIGLCLLDQHPLQIQHLGDHLRDLLFDKEAEIHGHLVVPAAGGVQALARVPDPLGEHGLDIHVDIFVLQGELHPAALDVRQDGLEAADDLFRLVRLDDPLLAQHGRMGDGACNILLVHPRVKGDRGVKIIDQGIGLLLEPACPEFHSIAPS